MVLTFRRKIIADTYGDIPATRRQLSGKDATKVDCTGAYACRYLAKNIVAASLASRREIRWAYAIGAAHLVSVLVDTFTPANMTTIRLRDAVTRSFDLRQL